MIAHRIGVGGNIEDLERDGPCEAFSASEIDQLLIEEYERSVVDDCNPEPIELLRGCYDRPFNGYRCLFSACFFSQCELSASSG